MLQSIVVATVLAASSPVRPAPPGVDFDARFGDFPGCFVLKEIGADWTLRFGDARCAERLAPCSTFKIFNALAALDSGVLDGPDATIPWDGKPKHFKAWQRDHTLATAIRDSVLWYFQEVARRIGLEGMKGYLDRCAYGNRSTAGGVDQFWLDGSLAISANEQADFLERLYADRLPFKPQAMKAVRKMLVLRKGDDWVFSGKTGTGGRDDRAILGWFVGHVRRGEREYVFALNIRAEEGARGQTARDIAFRILADLNLVEP